MKSVNHSSSAYVSLINWTKLLIVLPVVSVFLGCGGMQREAPQQLQATRSGIRSYAATGIIAAPQATAARATQVTSTQQTTSATGSVLVPSRPSRPERSANASASQTIVNIGDAPSDRIAAVAITINSMTLTDSSGAVVSVANSPMSVEMTRLLGAMQPLSQLAVPPGNYTHARMTIASAVVSYIDPISHNLVQKTVTGPFTAMINFNTPMNIAGTPTVLNLDMDMASSFSSDSAGNVTMTPTFGQSLGTIGAGNALDPEHGGMQHLIGSFSSSSGTTFSMSTLMGATTISFQTDGSTVFQGGLSGMGMMSNGMIMKIDAVMQSDGTVMAKTVTRMADPGGMMGGGFLSAMTGNPATKLTVIDQNGMGAGMMASDLANMMTANVSSGTVYRIDSDLMDLSGLPFTPVFDSSHIYAGQRVDVESGGGMMSGGMGSGMMSVNASEVDLEQQGFSGVVSNYSALGAKATFTLTVASDSAFATLTGSTAITVYQQSSSELFGLSSIANGNTIRVRGLLFDDAGTWKLVCSRIMAS